MSSSSPAPKDLVKMMALNASGADECVPDGKSSSSSMSCFEKVAMIDLQKTSSRLADMSQTIGLFRKYLFTKAHRHNIGKTNEEESQAIRRLPPRRPLLLPPKFDSSLSRPPSRLEQAIIPAMRCDAIHHSGTAQLTIFYSGTINVYDNIPADKAHAIMLLAGKSSSPDPVATDNINPQTYSIKPPPDQCALSSICKLEADLPIARKFSLQRFLEKRRSRTTNKSPYARSNVKHEDIKATVNNVHNLNENPGFSSSLSSPFPSRLSYFFPVSAKRAC